MSDNSLTITISEVAKLLGISRGLAYELAKQNKLPGLIHLGEKRMVVSRIQIEKLLNGNNESEGNKVDNNYHS